MSDLFADRLLEAIDAKGAPICVGIDPMFEMLPARLTEPAGQRDPTTRAIDAIVAFSTGVLDVVAPYAACVKFQSAYFEKYRWQGVEAYYRLVREAHRRGLLVIGDVKRGDIGATSAAYAAAHLTDPPFDHHMGLKAPDAITVNPFCGLDTIEPFVTAARDGGKGLFVLVRTSNPGSAELQDATLADGRTWSEALAEGLAKIAAGPGLVGDGAYSSIGAVVGATQPHTMRGIRSRLPQSIFLLPGYGAQGATGEMTRAAFQGGRGAIVSASRSILYAHREKKYAERFSDDWKKCVEAAAADMKADLAKVIGAGGK